MLYEDGSASPRDTYPLAAAVRTQEPQTAVRGHRNAQRSGGLDRGGGPPPPVPRRRARVRGARRSHRPHRRARLGAPASAAAGAARARRPVPLDIARILDEIPPHLFPEQFASEARRLSGGPVALYVLDIDGTHLLRLAGPEDFPERIEAPLALGPELAEDGIPELAARLASELPGASTAPMWLRGRAIGLLLALATPAEALAELARHGAAAMELAGGYTDVFDAARRRKDTHPAAELQQSLLPPRIARIGGGELAGSVLPPTRSAATGSTTSRTATGPGSPLPTRWARAPPRGRSAASLWRRCALRDGAAPRWKRLRGRCTRQSVTSRGRSSS